MTTYCLYTTATGKLVSIGTVLADPLPADLTALALSAEEAEGLKSGTMQWDDATRSLVPTPPPAVTAEEFLASVGLAGDRQPALLYLRLSLQAAGKTSPELDALEAYLAGILDTFATDPSPRSDWPQPPITFEAAVQAARQALNS